MLSSTLKRFLAVKPKAFGETVDLALTPPVLKSNVEVPTAAEKLVQPIFSRKKRPPRAKAVKRFDTPEGTATPTRRLGTKTSTPQLEISQSRTPVTQIKRNRKQPARFSQDGNIRLNWITVS